MKATRALTNGIAEKYKMPWWNVRGHDEVAFVRSTNLKVDPGPLFPWVDVVPGHPKVPVKQDATPVKDLEDIQEAKKLVRQMGYGGLSGVHDPETGKLNEDFLLHQFGNAVQAFKGRYVWPGNPEHYTPVLDRGTLETLRVLAPSVDHGAKKGL
jgi:N-acetyl-anhydromuramyl-L-alanine amidase AmpD